MLEALVQVPALHQLAGLAHGSTTQEDFKFRGYLQLHSKLEDSLRYMRPGLKNKNRAREEEEISQMPGLIPGLEAPATDPSPHHSVLN